MLKPADFIGMYKAEIKKKETLAAYGKLFFSNQKLE